MLSFLGLPSWGSSSKSSRANHQDDEVNQHLPLPGSTLSRTNSLTTRSYKTSPSQISISAPIPRQSGTSLTGFDNPYFGMPGGYSELWGVRPTSSVTRVILNPASSSSTSVSRVGLKANPFPHSLPSPPLSDRSDRNSNITLDGSTPVAVPAVIRIETDVVTPRLEEGPSNSSSGSGSSGSSSSRPQPVRKTLSSPPTPTSPYHHSSPAESTSSSSEFSPTLGSVAAGAAAGTGYGGRWPNLKLHTNHIYSQSTQSLPVASSSFVPPGGQFSHDVGMHSDTSLPQPSQEHYQMYDANLDQYAYAYSYPMVKQLSPIAEQDYFSPDSLKRTQSLPPSTATSRAGSDKDLRTSAVSGASLLTLSGSPIGSQTGSDSITRPSPIYSSPFISRALNRTASQTSSRTHVSGTSSAGPRQSLKLDGATIPPVIPPLDLRLSFPGAPQTPNYSHPSPTGSHQRRPFSNPMPIILGSTEGDDMDEEYAGHTDFTTESLHAESFVTASSEDDDRPANGNGRPTRGNFVREENNGGNIETVDQVEGSSMRPPPNYRGLPLETGSVRSAGSKVIQPPSASESFITRRWDRDVALGPGIPTPTFRAKKQGDVTPAFWAFWLGFLFPFLWLVGGWHFTHFGEQPPRLTFWEFYFNTGYWKEMCCGGRNKKREMDHLKREGKKVEPPPLPRWVSEKQSSELGRARLNDPKRSLRGISFGYPFIPRPVPMSRDETFFQGMVKRILHILGKPNRVFDQLYGIKLREVRGRPEGPRRMFDPWIQRCRYALCYAMLLLAIGLLVASTYLIVYNTRQL